MKSIYNRLEGIIRRIVKSIAFYPTMILVGFALFALFMSSFADEIITPFLYEYARALTISEADSARSILTVLIGGIISLAVFSFSMVMVVLSQASSNFSPRLLPELISNKTNQVVLGFYLGTILYNIIILIGIVETENAYMPNGFSTILGILFGVICLGFFAFFIHNISTNIQIDHILVNVFNDTKHRLMTLMEDVDEKEKQKPKEDQSGWHVTKMNKAGYYFGIDVSKLFEFANEWETDIMVVPYKGEFLQRNASILISKKELDENAKDNIRNLVEYSFNRNANDNYILGIKQITEVAVKAMSPGINDPGTAITTINYLTQLFALAMKIDSREIHSSEECSYFVEVTTISFRELIYDSLASYRQYSKHDVLIMKKLINMILYLKDQPCRKPEYKLVLDEQLTMLVEDFRANISNQGDIRVLEKLLEKAH